MFTEPLSRTVAGMTVLFLLLILVAPASAGLYTDSCGMVWADASIPFERNNETAYDEEMMASYAPIIANLTEEVPDFSNMSWSDAFRETCAYMEERYAFTEWRGVDWGGLYARYAPEIAEAERNRDNASYYRTLREFAYAIPDGHVMAAARDDFGAKYADIGGGYGLAVAGLDSGRVIVAYVADGSDAERAGIRFGDEVVSWNGRPVGEAINATSIIWAPVKPSTAEGFLLHRLRFLTRAPVGTNATVGIAGPADSAPRTINLTAADDGYDTLTRTSIFLGREVNDIGAGSSADRRAMITNDTVTYRTLPGGIAYIAVYEEFYDVYQPFRAAVKDAIAKGAPGVVVDLRYNMGGDDNLAAAFAGWFVNRSVFYEYGTTYDPGTGEFPVLWESWTEPRPDRYTGPVALLVSPYTISSGEGLPKVFAESGTGAIVSWYGTNGAFGMESMGPVLPLGILTAFPTGSSLDESGSIQVDSNASLLGGVAPTVRVPLDEETLARAMAGEDVQLSYAVDWIWTQAESTTAEPSAVPTRAAAGWVVPLAALMGLAVWFGRR
ncbi:peptidase S41 [Methanoculleus sp. Wushi-C6]|uniref:Peptidase S41 n=1 Tax=Methanoculleus caldifontis TaxID=2651577 RepID=A0ABU3WXY5_9EURY|nr:S41 family peptidase [Methanoculleus sp. Wushi-C6]MDV2480658.1 peptidase S41 [Methanoculleus sp. Wushi-C6]